MLMILYKMIDLENLMKSFCLEWMNEVKLLLVSNDMVFAL